MLQVHPTSTYHYSEHKWNEQDELNLSNVGLHFSKGIQWIVVLTEIHFQLYIHKIHFIAYSNLAIYDRYQNAIQL